eukprot:scaffold1234_cov248-Pinguiococcus_pyrenoidosus.AAC.13
MGPRTLDDLDTGSRGRHKRLRVRTSSSLESVKLDSRDGNKMDDSGSAGMHESFFQKARDAYDEAVDELDDDNVSRRHDCRAAPPRAFLIVAAQQDPASFIIEHESQEIDAILRSRSSEGTNAAKGTTSRPAASSSQAPQMSCAKRRRAAHLARRRYHDIDDDDDDDDELDA